MIIFLIIFSLFFTQTAEAGYFETRWPAVRERIESLAPPEILAAREVLDCAPSSGESAVPAIDLTDTISLQLAFPTEKYIKSCYPPENPLYTIFHREGEMIVYYLYEDTILTPGVGMVLKEWIYTEQPNTDTGSRYAWKVVSTETEANSAGLRVESSDDGGVTLTHDEQTYRIEPITYWNADGTEGSAVLESYVIQAAPTGSRNDEEAQPITNHLPLTTSHYPPTNLNLEFFIPASPKNYPLLIDPTINYGDWLGSVSEASSIIVNSLALETVNDEIYAGGVANAFFSLGTIIEGTYSGSSEGWVIEITDAATPTIAWFQWLGGGATDEVTALAVNGDEVYAGGNSLSSTDSWDTVSTQAGTYSGGSEGWVVEITDGATPTIAWLQWLGGGGSEIFKALSVNGDEVYAGGFSNSSTDSWDTVSTQAGTYSGANEGWVVEITDGATPAIAWLHWLGGGGLDSLSALVVNGDEVYVGGWTNGSTNVWETVSTIAGTGSNFPEGWVVEISDAATPTVSWLQWLGGWNGSEVLAVAVNGDEVYAGGYSIALTSWETVSTRAGTFSDGSEGFVVEISDAATPTIAWLQWLGAGGADVVNALTVNGDEVYAGGYSNSSTDSWDTVSIKVGTYSGSSEGWVVEITDAATPTIAWQQWLGGSGVDRVVTIAVNGDEVYAGGDLTTTNFETAGTIVGTLSFQFSGQFVLEVADAATPTITWLQGTNTYGNIDVSVLAMAVNGEEVYAGGRGHYSLGTGFTTIAGTDNGGNGEGFVIEIMDGVTPVLNWLQWLGGGSDDQANSLAINGDEVYAGGKSNVSDSWDTVSTQAGTYSGGSEGWVVEINDAATPTVAWLQWLGGEGHDVVNDLAVNGELLYVGGHSSNISGSVSWETVSTQAGTHSGGSEGWVVEISDGTTPTIVWFQWLGGGGTDIVSALAVNGDEVYAGGNSNDSGNWDTVSTQAGTYTAGSEGWVVEITDGTTPTIVWLQWLGGGSADVVSALAVNGDEVYAGGRSTNISSWDTVSTQAGTHSGFSEGFVVEITDAATPTIAWLQWLGAGGTDGINALEVTGDEVYVGGNSNSSTDSWDTVSIQSGTYSGGSEGWVVEITDGATPTVAWLQWLGGGSTDAVNALAVSGDEVYVGGFSLNVTSWEVTMPDNLSEQVGFYIEISDDVTAGGGGSSNDTIFFDMMF